MEGEKRRAIFIWTVQGCESHLISVDFVLLRSFFLLESLMGKLFDVYSRQLKFAILLLKPISILTSCKHNQLSILR